MAKKTDPIDETPDEQPDEVEVDTRSPEEKMADRIADGVARGIAATAPQKVTFSRYDPKTSWQKGMTKKQMPRLTRPCFQNGMMMDDGKMTAEEINLMNQLSVSGRYIDRRVEVVIREEGTQNVLELRYSDTINHTLELKGLIRVAKSTSPLANMIYHILDEVKGVYV
jgi:hypothetical protein